MDFATLFAWLVIAILFIAAVAAIVALGALPARIARQRKHPHAEAINAASWIGLALGGVAWPIAFIWAFTPCGAAVDSATATVSDSAAIADLRRQVADLQAEMQRLKQTRDKSA